MKEKISKLVNVYRKNGFVGFWKKLYAYVVANYLNKISFDVMLRPDHYRAEIRRMLLDRDFDRVVLWRSSFGYDVPLYQRPQHISRNLAKNGCLVLNVGPREDGTFHPDAVKQLKRIGEWLRVTSSIGSGSRGRGGGGGGSMTADGRRSWRSGWSRK